MWQLPTTPLVSSNNSGAFVSSGEVWKVPNDPTGDQLMYVLLSSVEVWKVPNDPTGDQLIYVFVDFR